MVVAVGGSEQRGAITTGGYIAGVCRWGGGGVEQPLVGNQNMGLLFQMVAIAIRKKKVSFSALQGG